MVFSQVPNEEQLKVFIKYKNELFVGSRAKPCTADVYKKLSKKLGMTPQAIRVSVMRKINAISGPVVKSKERSTSPNSTVNQYIESNDANDQTDEIDAEKFDHFDESIESAAGGETSAKNNREINAAHEAVADDSDVQVNRKTICFELELDPESVFKIENRKAGKRMKQKVTVGWGWKLRNVLWEHFKSQCCWVFKSADPKANGDVVTKGECKTCGAIINVHSSAAGNTNVEIKNFDASKNHPRRKARVAGDGKSYYTNLLKNNSAHLVHINEINKLMKKGEPEPAHIPTTNALNIMKCRSGSTSTSFPKDGLWSLVELKCMFGADIIGDISIFPFVVHYALPMQREFFKMAIKHKRSIISLDATGMGIRTSNFLPKECAPEKMPVFLYTIACHSAEKTMPIYQLLTNRHTLNFHAAWLTEWKKQVKKIDEIIVDDSAALVGACAKALAKCNTTNQYISKCMNSVLYEAAPSTVYIRLDISHFVRSLRRLNGLKQLDLRARVLYKRIFGFLIRCENLRVIEKVIRNLFIVVRSKYATDICMQSLEYLIEICAMDPNEVAEEEEDHVGGKIYENEDTGKIRNQEKKNSIFQANDDETYKNTTSYR